MEEELKLGKTYKSGTGIKVILKGYEKIGQIFFDLLDDCNSKSKFEEAMKYPLCIFPYSRSVKEEMA